MTKKRRPKNAALNPHYNSKIKQEFIDYDYLDKLTPELKDFLAGFTEETINARFNHSNIKVHKKNRKKVKKQSYDANNARNRDAFSVYNTSNKMMRLDGAKNDGSSETNKRKDSSLLNVKSPEDSIIKLIDLKKKMKRLK